MGLWDLCKSVSNRKWLCSCILFLLWKSYSTKMQLKQAEVPFSHGCSWPQHLRSLSFPVRDNLPSHRAFTSTPSSLHSTDIGKRFTISRPSPSPSSVRLLIALLILRSDYSNTYFHFNSPFPLNILRFHFKHTHTHTHNDRETPP